MTRPAPLAPILRLALVRARRRVALTGLTAAAVAAGAALVLILAGLAGIAGAAAIGTELAAQPARAAAVRVSWYESTLRNRNAVPYAELAVDELEAYGSRPVSGMLLRRTRSATVPVELQLLALDAVGDRVALADGRLPNPCDGRRCEAVLLSSAPPEVDLGGSQRIGELELEIVGRATFVGSVPFVELDQRGPGAVGLDAYGLGAPPAAGLLLVEGTVAAATADGIAHIGRTYVTAVPLAAETLRPWTVGRFEAALERTTTRLAAGGIDAAIESPLGAVRAGVARAGQHATRLATLGALGVAMLLAFAVFSAIVARLDVTLEDDRLNRSGATRSQRAWLLIGEAATPVVVGVGPGLLAGIVAVAALAGADRIDPVELVTATIVQPAAIAAIGALLAAATFLLVVGYSAGTSWRQVTSGVAIGTVITVLVLGWQVVAGGPAAATASGPLALALPPAVAFLAVLAALAVLPGVLRWFARRASHGAIWLRLALISLARDPGRPAATIMLLALSVGLLAFGAGYRASVDQSAADRAAHRAGLDLRIAEVGSDVTVTPNVAPVDRYEGLGEGLDVVPVVRISGSEPGGGPIELIGLDPAALPRLPGWRAGYSDTDITTLATRIGTVGPVRSAGQPLPAGTDELELVADWRGPRLRWTAVVEPPGGGAVRVALPDLVAGRKTYRAALPAPAVGGTLLALVLSEAGLVAGEYHDGELRRGELTIRNMPGLVADQQIAVDLSGVEAVTIRATQQTDRRALPAIVSPQLAAAADQAGVVAVRFGAAATLRLEVVGVARAFPTAEPGAGFAVVAGDVLTVASSAEQPGVGVPREVWIGLPDAESETAVRERLGQAPFRAITVVSRSEQIAAAHADPIARSLAVALAVAGLIALILAMLGVVLGALSDLRDEGGELADLEAQGVAPSVLRRRAVARAGILSVSGTIAGVAVGLVLNQLVIGTPALAAATASVVPPPVVVQPLGLLLVFVVTIVASTLAGVALLTRRSRLGAAGLVRG